MFWVAATLGSPLPLFFDAVQATGQQLGMMGAVRQFAMLAQIPAALLLERLARRKPFWAAVTLSHRILCIVPTVLIWFFPQHAAHFALWTIVAFSISELLGNLGAAPWLSWMADLVPAEKSGRFWGVRHGWLSASLVGAAVIYAWLLDAAPTTGALGAFAVIFLLCTIGGTSDVLVHMAVHEPRPHPHPDGHALWTRILAPMRDAGLRRVTLAFSAWGFAVALPGVINGLPGFFNITFLHDAFGASYGQASLVFVTAALGGALFGPRIGRAMDEQGAQRVGTWLMSGLSLASFAWWLLPGRETRWTLPLLGEMPAAVPCIGLVFVLIGALGAGMYLCQLRLTAEHTPVAGRTLALAVHWAVFGLLSSAGPMAAGWVKDHFPAGWSAWTLPGGVTFSYFHVLIAVQALVAFGVAMPLLAGVKKTVLR